MLLVTMLDGPVSQIVFKSLWFGILSGMVSGMVKIGWKLSYLHVLLRGIRPIPHSGSWNKWGFQNL